MTTGAYDARKWDSETSSDAELNRCAQALAEMAAIGDTVYMPCLEPLLEIRIAASSSVESLKLSWPERISDHERVRGRKSQNYRYLFEFDYARHATGIFQIDRQDDAVAFMERIAKARGIRLEGRNPVESAETRIW